ncbi:Os01g0755601, partial [Oryza sativa Japonica Group]
STSVPRWWSPSTAAATAPTSPSRHGGAGGGARRGSGRRRRTGRAVGSGVRRCLRAHPVHDGGAAGPRHRRRGHGRRPTTRRSSPWPAAGLSPSSSSRRRLVSLQNNFCTEGIIT